MNRLLAASILAAVSACMPYGTAGYTQVAQRSCGNPQASYENGYNAGAAHQQMYTGWVDQYCAPAYQQQTRQAYLAGFQAGAAAAPAVVQAQPGYGAQPAYGPAPGPAYGAAMPPKQCELNSDGSHTCGYNCELGSSGQHYCASTPQDHCAMNSDGTWTCP